MKLSAFLCVASLAACAEPTGTSRESIASGASRLTGPVPAAPCGSVSYEGCCDGATVYYCDTTSGALASIDCTANPSCGWSSTGSYYDCGTSGGADPAGTNAKACTFGDAGPPQMDSGTPDASAGCGSVTSEGCCTGAVLSYCSGGTIQTIDCTSNPSCGWDSSSSYYDCGTSGGADPSGTHAKACSGTTADTGPAADAPTTDTSSGSCGNVSYQGCCDGATVWYCDTTTGLSSINCSSNPSCGWSSTGSYYDCGTSGGADPSGTNPKPCTGMFGDAGPPISDLGTSDATTTPDTSTADASAGCGSVTSEGCCTGAVLSYCSGGTVQTIDCTSNPSCGWDSTYSYYDCGTSGGTDPSGTNPKACGGSTADGSTGVDTFPMDFSVNPDTAVSMDTGPAPDGSSPAPDGTVPAPDSTVPAPDGTVPAPDSTVTADQSPMDDQGATADQSGTDDLSSNIEGGMTTDDAGAKPKDDDGGCNCAVSNQGAPDSWPLMLLGLLAGLFFRRRR